MSSLLLLVSFAIGQPSAVEAVTESQKKDFIKLLQGLPAKGDLLELDDISKAVPHSYVLLALSEMDLPKFELYPVSTLIEGLSDYRAARAHAVANFNKIAHPDVKRKWAVSLFRRQKAPPEAISYLRKEMEARPEKFELGPEFEPFKRRVIEVDESGKGMKLGLVKKHALNAFPLYEPGSGGDYTDCTYMFASGPQICAVKPLSKEQCGELITYSLKSGRAIRRKIPQPAGFKPEIQDYAYFRSPRIAMNGSGDLLCRWDIGGNGDHGFALLKKDDPAFRVARIKEHLGYSNMVSTPDGTWYVIQHDGRASLNYFHLNDQLVLNLMGKTDAFHVNDARCISNEIIHLFCSDGTGLRFADFDIRTKRLLHNREIYKLEVDLVRDQAVVLQGTDSKLHYLWTIKDRRFDPDPDDKKPPKMEGFYYQAEEDAALLRIDGLSEFKAVLMKDFVVVCYTQRHAPKAVFFRSIRNGLIGPKFELAMDRIGEFNPGGNYMALHAEGERVWFANTLEPNIVYELKLVDEK